MRPLAAGYEELFRMHYVPLVRALTLVARTPEDAADAVQDAFVQLHRHWPRVQDMHEPAAWLRRVATNKVIDQHRRAKRARKALEGYSAGVPTDPTAAGADVWEDVRGLPDRQRCAVGLFYLAGLPVAEVAEAMGISDGTVKSLLHNARQNLRARVEVPDHE
ncbi:MAG TPA: sigma-70 family RNA polymerase sigma factor [Acidimicrobiia bacterium]|nr:sigma-70 family RNA polymerase sigma factor [Acidimicrobiia bacterium]